MIVRPEEIHRDEAAEALPPGRAPWVTRALLASIAAFWLLQSALPDQMAGLAMGANSATLVAQGQWDRLITANWLHGGLFHIGLNALWLYLFGRLLENIFGPWRFLLIYIVSCIAGAAASAALSGAPFSVGASTGVVGLLGCLGAMQIRFRDSLPRMLRGRLRGWIFLIVINGLFAVVVEGFGIQIDHWGHAGGFLGGALTTLALSARWPSFRAAHRPAPIARVLASILVVITLVAFGVSLSRLGEGTLVAWETLATTVLADADAEPGDANNAAWPIAIHPDATEEGLRTALVLAERATDDDADLSDEERLAYLDTLATVHFRLGHLDEAVRIQRDVVEGAEPDEGQAEVYRSQLARFLDARLRRDGPVRLPENAPAELVVRIEHDAKGHGSQELVVTVPDPGRPYVFYAVVRDGEALLGLVDGTVPADGAGAGRFDLDPRWADGADASVALVDVVDDAGEVSLSAVSVRGTEMDEDVAGYP